MQQYQSTIDKVIKTFASYGIAVHFSAVSETNGLSIYFIIDEKHFQVLGRSSSEFGVISKIRFSGHSTGRNRSEAEFQGYFKKGELERVVNEVKEYLSIN